MIRLSDLRNPEEQKRFIGRFRMGMALTLIVGGLAIALYYGKPGYQTGWFIALVGNFFMYPFERGPEVVKWLEKHGFRYKDEGEQ